jgi:hypothetical protein
MSRDLLSEATLTKAEYEELERRRALAQKENGWVRITGNTFYVKEELKKLGAQFDEKVRGWFVPAENAAAARRLVNRR